MPAKLANGLAQSVEVRGAHDAEIVRPGQRSSGDQRQCCMRFRELFLSVVNEAGVEDVSVLCEA